MKNNNKKTKYKNPKEPNLKEGFYEEKDKKGKKTKLQIKKTELYK